MERYRELLEIALNEAQSLNAACEARISLVTEEAIQAKNTAIELYGFESSTSFGATVYYRGSFGFASTTLLDKENIIRTVRQAFEIARLRAEIKKSPIFLPELLSIEDEKSSSYEIDPVDVSFEEKSSLLVSANEEALKYSSKGVAISISTMRAIRRDLFYANTEGSYIHQKFIHSGAEVQVYALRDDELQMRSFPARDSSFSQAGFEYVKKLALKDGAAIAAEQAVELLHAPLCPYDTYEAVISSDQVALQIHESVGHPVELDRVIGYEVSLAGASYLTLEDAGKKEIAAKEVNIVADALFPAGNGSFFYDDEGTPAKKFPIIENGILINFLSSRESALSIGKKSNGCARAQSASYLPIVRMTNLNLLPSESGPNSLEEMISDIKSGIFLQTTKSWSIDDLRLNFQFGIEYAREIKNGRLGRVFKNATYTGITPEFWKNVVAIGSEKTFQMWGFLNCGKGDPIQLMAVGHGAPLIRKKNLKVGSSR